DFKQPSEAILSKFKDWRSDVNSLPDSTHLELISEYQNFLARLENDNLPKFEKKLDRKSTRLNSSHVKSSYAVFCLKKKNKLKSDSDRQGREKLVLEESSTER